MLHGIQGNPLVTLCHQLKLPLQPLREECPLKLASGQAVDPSADTEVEALFNRVLEMTDSWRSQERQRLAAAAATGAFPYNP